jgi:hypothetical protein
MPREAPRHESTREIRQRLAAGEQLFPFTVRFRAERSQVPDAPAHSGAVPNQTAARVIARDYLQTLPQYTPTDPFPIYLRNGFRTLDAYVNAHFWSPSGGGLIGSRMDYTLIVPIFNPATNFVLHNLMPASGTGQLVRSRLDENNANLFWNQ